MSRTPRIFIEQPLSAGTPLVLPDGAQRHLVRVLRLGDGDEIVLFNGDGLEYPARLTAVGRRHAEAIPAEPEATRRESPLELTLALCISKPERMDWGLQKAVELGVTRIVPVISEHCAVRLGAERGEKKQSHWRGILVAAAEQCGRTRLPELAAQTAITELDAQLGAGTRWQLDADAETALIDADPDPGPLSLLIGPEGGFGPADREAAAAQGFRALRLGPRTLRTETAVAAALCLVQARHGDLR